MNKALEMLSKLRRIELIYSSKIFLLREFDEAIAELEEAIKPKSCEGCLYDDEEVYKTLIEAGHDIHICSLCTRGTNDYYKPKEQL